MFRGAQQAGWEPQITSTVRDRGRQQELWEDCQFGRAPFPVKQPGCSQHEFGYAFDMKVARGAFVADQPVPGRLATLACSLLGICGDPAQRERLPAAQALLQIRGRQLGLSTSQGDPVHFSVFPSSVWDPHMRSEFGIGCRTCLPRDDLDLGEFFTARIF